MGKTLCIVNDTGSWNWNDHLVSRDGSWSQWVVASVDIDGDTAAVGTVDLSSGAVYVFERDAPGSWSQQAWLVSSGGTIADSFGSKVAVSGDAILVGAGGDDWACPNDIFCGAGAAYLLPRDARGSWTQHSKLTVSDAAWHDALGASMAIDGDTAVVGMPGSDEAFVDDRVCDSVAAYVFDLRCAPHGMGHDSDSGGVPNSLDSCPTDPEKTDPDGCGCGFEEVDGDSDGVADCIDGCPGTPAGIPVMANGCVDDSPGEPNPGDDPIDSPVAPMCGAGVAQAAAAALLLLPLLRCVRYRERADLRCISVYLRGDCWLRYRCAVSAR